MKSNAPGEFLSNTDGYEIRFERHLNHNILKVWDAITNTDIMRIWFTDVEMDFREGGKMTIWFRDADRTQSTGEIMRIDPPHHFSWMWDNELAVWELEAISEQETLLKFAYSRISREWAASVPAGWHIVLDHLSDVLDGTAVSYDFGDGSETPEERELKAMYKSLIMDSNPELFS
jgi:uncharacterized protein YndB with AHSA1/START domain